MKCKFEHDGDCCNCGSPQYMCKCKPKICDSVVPMTNADHLRSMSDEELGTWLIRMSEGDEHIEFCVYRPECTADLEQDREIPQERCAECVLFWLRQPYEEGTK
ncbi:MAG: hypothetical protein ACLSE7_00945 [Lachnospirales bacterium]